MCNNFTFTLDHDCFPSISTLQLKNGEVVKMSELQIGDQVKTGDRKKCKIDVIHMFYDHLMKNVEQIIIRTCYQ